MLICDAGPRDGLKNESTTLPPERRAELCNRLAAAGVRRIEATSFVSESKVPQMAGAEQVVAGLDRGAGAEYAGLVLNERGSRNTGYANAVAAVESGVEILDASVGMGHATGVDLDALIDCSGWLEEQLGHELPGRVRKAGALVSAGERAK